MFLNDRKIIDVIGITQEVIHSIKKSDLYALLLKMDLVKAYDMVDMVYFIVCLLQIGASNFRYGLYYVLWDVNTICYVD